MIDKAIENILKSVQTLNDVYAIAVVSYALELANHSSKKELIDRLISLAKTNGKILEISKIQSIRLINVVSFQKIINGGKRPSEKAFSVNRKH